MKGNYENSCPGEKEKASYNPLPGFRGSFIPSHTVKNKKGASFNLRAFLEIFKGAIWAF